MKQVKGSVYILVLILLMVSVLFVGVLYKTLNLNILQFTLEKKTAELERLLQSGLDQATREYLDNPTAFLNKESINLNEYNICGEDPTLYNKDQRCSNDSQIQIKQIKQIIGYLTKNGETLQVMLSTPPNAPLTGDNGSIEIHTNPNIGGDKILVSSYYYDSSLNTLKIGGACVILYSNNANSISGSSCMGALQVSNLTAEESNIQTYGKLRVRISPMSSGRVSFYRVKLLTKVEEPVYLSITGANYTDLPLVQEIVLTGIAYSDAAEADSSKTVRATISRAIMAQPSFPEVFDWALFNGSDQSIVK